MSTKNENKDKIISASCTWKKKEIEEFNEIIETLQNQIQKHLSQVDL